MQGAAEAAAGRNRDNCSSERQTDRNDQPVFVDAEPPPNGIFDADFRVDAGERRFRFTETK